MRDAPCCREGARLAGAQRQACAQTGARARGGFLPPALSRRPRIVGGTPACHTVSPVTNAGGTMLRRDFLAGTGAMALAVAFEPSVAQAQTAGDEALRAVLDRI